MVSNLGCAPDAVPQWESGRIAFLKFLPFGIGSYRDWCGEARYFRADFYFQSDALWHCG